MSRHHGRTTRAHPAWAGGYEVAPDDRAAQAAADRTSLGHLKDAINRSPMERMGDGPSLKQAAQKVRESLLEGIAIRWLDVRECEVVVQEVAQEFGSEDPLKAGPT